MKTFLIIILSIIALPLLAQFPPPPASGGGPAVPIDGGLISIIGAGVAYGVHKYRKGRKNNKSA